MFQWLNGKSGGQIAMMKMAIVGLIALAIILAIMPIVTGLTIGGAITRLESSGYVVFAAGEYASLQSSISDLQNEVAIVEVHLHSSEIWMGISADQSGNDWCLPESLTPFQAISGNAAFGSDANDEAKVMGTVDTPHIVGSTRFDVHRLVVTAADVVRCLIMGNDWEGCTNDADTGAATTPRIASNIDKNGAWAWGDNVQ